MEILAMALVASIYVGLLGLITANIMYPMGRKQKK
jgi:hypothetical protein